jgi:hypothetical protein
VADGAEDGVGGVVVAAFEVAAAEVAVMWPITGSIAERRLSSRLMTPNTPRF